MARDYYALLERLESRRSAHQRRTSLNRLGREFGGLYPPAPALVIRAAEDSLGFPLPPLLGAIYRKLANGGFGPGCGIVGIAGGYRCEDLLDLTLVDYHHGLKAATAEFTGQVWPEQWLTICSMGCTLTYVIDCSQPDYSVLSVDGLLEAERVGSFENVMDNWASGKD